MKKYFVLILTVLILMTCFTACKPELKDGALIQNAAGENYAAVTKEDGGIVRDEAGNLVLLVTDKNGKNVKDDNGEYQTNPIALEHALVVGNRIECPDYALTIPDGWADSYSFSDLVIKRNGTEDQIKIITNKEDSLDDLATQNNSVISTINANYKNAVSENKGITIGDGISAQFMSAFVPDTGYRDENDNIMATYVGYIIFENNGIVYNCMLSSNRDISNQIEEITDILGTIEFIH